MPSFFWIDENDGLAFRSHWKLNLFPWSVRLFPPRKEDGKWLALKLSETGLHTEDQREVTGAQEKVEVAVKLWLEPFGFHENKPGFPKAEVPKTRGGSR